MAIVMKNGKRTGGLSQVIPNQQAPAAGTPGYVTQQAPRTPGMITPYSRMTFSPQQTGVYGNVRINFQPAAQGGVGGQGQGGLNPNNAAGAMAGPGIAGGVGAYGGKAMGAWNATVNPGGGRAPAAGGGGAVNVGSTLQQQLDEANRQNELKYQEGKDLLSQGGDKQIADYRNAYQGMLASLDGLSNNQQIAEQERLRAGQSQLQQSLINRGLANTTVGDPINARLASESQMVMNQIGDSRLQQALGLRQRLAEGMAQQTAANRGDLAGWIERKVIAGPDPSLYLNYLAQPRAGMSFDNPYMRQQQPKPSQRPGNMNMMFGGGAGPTFGQPLYGPAPGQGGGMYSGSAYQGSPYQGSPAPQQPMMSPAPNYIDRWGGAFAQPSPPMMSAAPDYIDRLGGAFAPPPMMSAAPDYMNQWGDAFAQPSPQPAVSDAYDQQLWEQWQRQQPPQQPVLYPPTTYNPPPSAPLTYQTPYGQQLRWGGQ